MADHDMLFKLCEGEQIVRTFEITRLRRFFAEDAIGRLTVTNQRIIYHSQAKSATGESQILSEMPLDDVSGFSTSMSASFNWVIFIVLAIVLYFANQVLFDILPRFLTHWAVGIILILPYALLFLFEKNILSAELREQAVKNLQDITNSSPLKDKNVTFYRPIFQVLMLIGADLVAFNIAFAPEVSYRMPWLGILLVLAADLIIYFLIFGRYRIFTLQLMSKTAKGTGINIEGDPLSRIFGGDRTAAQTLQSGPGQDSDEVISELGAMLTDIRLLGDLGIQKWIKLPAD